MKMFMGSDSILSVLIIISLLHIHNVSSRTVSDIMNAHGNESNNLKPLYIPVECHNTKYCSIKPKNYPDELINKILNNMKHRKLLLTSEFLNNETPTLWGNDDCEKKNLNITIYTIPNDNSLIVINTKEFPQILKGQLCENRASDGYQDGDMKCFKDFESQFCSETYCKQMYTAVKLLALNIVTKSLQYIYVRDFPVSCSCHYKTKLIDFDNYD